VLARAERASARGRREPLVVWPESECLIDNPLVRIHCIVVMIRWTGLAPYIYPPMQVEAVLAKAERASARGRREPLVVWPEMPLRHVT